MPTTSCSCLRVDRTAGAAASNGALPLRMIACDPMQLKHMHTDSRDKSIHGRAGPQCLRCPEAASSTCSMRLCRPLPTATRPVKTSTHCNQACVDLYPLQPRLRCKWPRRPVVQVAAAVLASLLSHLTRHGCSPSEATVAWRGSTAGCEDKPVPSPPVHSPPSPFVLALA